MRAGGWEPGLPGAIPRSGWGQTSGESALGLWQSGLLSSGEGWGSAGGNSRLGTRTSLPGSAVIHSLILWGGGGVDCLPASISLFAKWG